LVIRAEYWLKSIGFKTVIRDPFKAATKEQPDVIGWRYGVSVLIECKSSFADFRKDQTKSFRQNPEKGMGQWRLYFAPKGLIEVTSLPEKWGLLETTQKKVFRTYGVPPGNIWSNPPFAKFNQEAERILLISALRRLEVRGYLPEIYDGIPNPREMSTRWYPFSSEVTSLASGHVIIEYTHQQTGLKKYCENSFDPESVPLAGWKPTRYCAIPHGK